MGGYDILHRNPNLHHHARRHQESKVKSPDEPWFLERFLSVDRSIMFNYIWVVVSKIFGSFIPNLWKWSNLTWAFFLDGLVETLRKILYIVKLDHESLEIWSLGTGKSEEILGPSEGEDGEAREVRVAIVVNGGVGWSPTEKCDLFEDRDRNRKEPK